MTPVDTTAPNSLARENYALHKLHSLTGVVPVGYYMAQHLLLNSYSLAGPDKFDGVINFFDSIPKYVLLSMEVLLIWIPLLFHAIYGVLIFGRSQPNFIGTRYGWSQNRMYTFQRWTGVFLFFALIIHVGTTTVMKYWRGDSDVVKFASWQGRLTDHYYIGLVFYVLLVFCASYHLGYGIWNFCIRWGITVSERAQVQVQKLSLVVFICFTLLGWGALTGFLINGRPATTAAEAPAQPDPRPSGEVHAQLMMQPHSAWI